MTQLAHPQARRKPNRWVEAITDAWRCAMLAWEAEAEEVAIGYRTELEEFASTHPKPRLKDFMVHMSQPGKITEQPGGKS